MIWGLVLKKTLDIFKKPRYFLRNSLVHFQQKVEIDKVNTEEQDIANDTLLIWYRLIFDYQAESLISDAIPVLASFNQNSQNDASQKSNIYQGSLYLILFGFVGFTWEKRTSAYYLQ